MNPRIHKVGSSFKGLAAYLLHDKDASSAERVAWVETHNIGTDNPQTAWKVMVATAMKQQELKKAAGISAQGQKAKGTVLHYSLSWAEHEADDLTPEEMVRAAKASMAVYGVDPALFKPSAKNIPKRRQYADEHQAMIICHTDEKHPHVHIMVNRVHPLHGAILPNGKDQEKLSKWALEYERSRGEVLAKNRERNWDMRDRGIWIKDDSHEPRHIWEMRNEALRESANDNDTPALQRLKAAQKAENDALAKVGGEQAKRHRQAWIDLSEAHKARQADIRAERVQLVKDAKQASAAEYAPQFSDMQKRHERERDAYKSEERGLIDEASNVWKSVKILAKLLGEDPKSVGLRDYAAPFFGAGGQFELKLKEQAAEKRALEREQDAKLSSAIGQAKVNEKAALTSNTNRYTRDKADLVFVHDMEDAALKTRWKKRNDEQRGLYAEFAAKAEQAKAMKDDYDAAIQADWEDDMAMRQDHDRSDDHEDDQGM
jgi:relaxase-like protein